MEDVPALIETLAEAEHLGVIVVIHLGSNWPFEAPVFDQVAELIDWDAIAHSRQEWFIKDQTHLSYKGSEAYVTAIQEKLGKTP